jgi:signal transduction histidine kinase
LSRTLLVPLTAVVVTAGAALGATAGAPADGRALVGWYSAITAVLLSVVVTVTATRERTVRRLRADIAASEAAVEQLADTTVPGLVARLRKGASAESALAAVGKPGNGAHQRILTTLAQELARSERTRSAAMSACANAAGRVQALATSMLADLREMEERHEDEDVLGDLLHLDHRTAQAGRLADSIAVLTGARSGRRWTKPIVMESILRGAMGRISAYQRVRLHSASTAAVAGHAAEGVMHALAELMDNAANFSPPTAEVHIYVEDSHTGVVITVDDGGLTMSEPALARAVKAVSGTSLELSALSGTRLGLAVVGVLARKHGLTVTFRPSSRGGTGVVLLVPPEIITQPRQNPAPAAPFPTASPSMPSAPTATPTAGPGSASDRDDAQELPKRRRGQTLAAASRSVTPPGPASPRPSAAEVGSRFGAFRSASRRNGTSTGTGTNVPVPPPVPTAGPDKTIGS